jgi:hypothetical protein
VDLLPWYSQEPRLASLSEAFRPQGDVTCASTTIVGAKKLPEGKNWWEHLSAFFCSNRDELQTVGANDALQQDLRRSRPAELCANSNQPRLRNAAPVQNEEAVRSDGLFSLNEGSKSLLNNRQPGRPN